LVLVLERWGEKHEQLSNGRSKGQIENPHDLLPALKGSGTEFYITGEDGSSFCEAVRT
jgi:hypothetical protein